MVVRAVLVVGLLASHATAETVKAPACGPAKTATITPRTVRDVDWCNAAVGGLWHGALKEGRSEIHEYAELGGEHDTIIHTLRGVVAGDLDGNGTLEAALVIERQVYFANSGHDTSSTRVYLYALVKGAPALLGSIGAGGEVSEITLGNGIVVVTSGPKGNATTKRYRRARDAFVEVKK